MERELTVSSQGISTNAAESYFGDILFDVDPHQNKHFVANAMENKAQSFEPNCLWTPMWFKVKDLSSLRKIVATCE